MKQIKTVRRRDRAGLSIIEVLTSIIVAMIGVFGIMVLIPFSIKQSQSGLDRDAATVLARNAMAKFEIQGYRDPNNWLEAGNTRVDPTAPQMYMLDPLYVAENANTYTAFPYLTIGAYPVDYEIDSASVVDSAGNTMTLGDARRMFIGGDELSLLTPNDELNGPVQQLDASSVAAVGNVRRQFGGSLSWAVLQVPYKSLVTDVGAAWSYRSYVIVYKRRAVDVADPEMAMFTAQIRHTGGAPLTPTGLASPVGAVYLDTTPTLPDEYSLAKDSWVMLINKRDTAGTPPAVEPGFEDQVGFYRVVNYDIDEVPGARKLQSITLDGPDFDFGDPSDTANWNPAGTYLIHLKDVIAVYERSIVPERPSNWN
ncbi:MAG: hypothetical protein AAFN77_08160 [Planctomycetota bacterium]